MQNALFVGVGTGPPRDGGKSDPASSAALTEG
jgi:hypothetical protein